MDKWTDERTRQLNSRTDLFQKDAESLEEADWLLANFCLSGRFDSDQLDDVRPDYFSTISGRSLASILSILGVLIILRIVLPSLETYRFQ